MRATNPVMKDLVLIGGGHSHVAVLKAFGMWPLPGVRITLISKDIHTPYSGMLPGLIAGHYDFDAAHIDLQPLSRFAGARFFRDEVIGIDARDQHVMLKGRPPVSYDALSINSGSTPSTRDVPGAAGTVVPVKPIHEFLEHWKGLCERVTSRSESTRIGVVGAGAGGVELALAAQHALRSSISKDPSAAPRFELLSATEEILSGHPPAVARRFRRILAERGIVLHAGARVTEVSGGGLRDAAGREHAFDEIVWVTQAGAPAWLAEAGLAVDGQGFLLVNEFLQSISHPSVFGAGDVAAMAEHPRPKAGVFAVRQGPPLHRNLRGHLLHQRLSRYRPQRNFLTLISTGNRYAVASRGGWSAEGRWVWRWKDWIDRRFMRRFQELPEMAPREEQPVPAALLDGKRREELEDSMRCGGCGAKVGSDVLAAALADIEAGARSDIVVGLNQPDDAALISVANHKLAALSVDAFRPMIADPFVFGQITANHCLGDLYAMGAEPQSAMAIATLPVWPEDKLIEELRQMLLGAIEVLRTEGAALVGGHTSEGAELSLGFSVTGLIDRDAILHKSSLRAGDALILTKPIGTGTILAADMRAKARGRWVFGAVEAMLESSREAGRTLREHGASACTDITGFGLAVHLLEMLGNASLGATLEIDAVPPLEGALDTLAAGFVSTMQPKNQRALRRLTVADRARAHPAFPLLFDPQTAGGLLAGVPGDRADACVAALVELGFARSAIIGEVHGEGGSDPPIRIQSRTS
jgi:selenide,water dikinase